MCLKAATSAVRLVGGISEGCQGIGRVASVMSCGLMMDVVLIGMPVSMERLDHRSAISLNGLE